MSVEQPIFATKLDQPWFGPSAASHSEANLGLDDGLSSDAAESSALAELRSVALKVILWSSWIITTAIALMAIWGGAGMIALALCSAGVSIVPLFLSGDRRSETVSRWIAVMMVSLQPMALLVALRLGEYAALTPLANLVALVALAILCDRRAIVFTSAAVFLLLVATFLLAPGWLFVSDMLWRDALYLAELVIVSIVAYKLAGHFEHLVVEAERAKSVNHAQMNLMREQARDLERALHRVEEERDQRAKLEADQQAARKAELDRIASDFEASISVVTQSIAKTANLLTRTTSTLNAIAHDTDQSAADVSISAEAASKAARTVAQGVAELSNSIATVAINVSQQNELTSRATQRSHSGGEAVGGLAQHSDTIGEATRAIVRIAEQTNLLSLNAAIEAATAGPAGRGFTIVAQEVKALANQASEAATQINEFLSGVRSGTLEAERSFEAIDSAITELDQAATSIRWDVESQRKSADTIEDYARSAAEDVGAMAERSRSLASTASATEKLSSELDDAAAAMLKDVRDLEQSTAQFMANLKAS